MLFDMAWRFTNLVEGGEIDNTVRGRVAGWIRLTGRAERLPLELRGDCRPDLAGWRFRIVRIDPVPPWAEPVNIDGLASEQVGRAGDITADRILRHYDCPVEELLARIAAGEPPPTEWRKTLYLEWYSDRNGRVVIQSTRLRAERIGERAFELTKEDHRRKDEEATRQLDELREEGFVFEEHDLGVMVYRKEDVASDDTESDELRSYLDQQTRDIDRDIQDSLEQPPEDDCERKRP
jgi:hypothetical protein